MSSPGSSPLELPRYSLDVQAMDLGEGVKAVGLELLETESREPVRGREASEIWAAVLPALAASDPYVVDFFSHVDRVREFCAAREIEFREAAGRCVVLPQPDAGEIQELFERFETETFGFRAGASATEADAGLEGELSGRGLDAYQSAYPRYAFCAVCEPEDGWLTVLSGTLWASEIIRRVRPAVKEFDIHLARPQ